MPLIKKRAAKAAKDLPTGRQTRPKAVKGKVVKKTKTVARKRTAPREPQQPLNQTIQAEKAEEAKFYSGPVIQKFTEEKPFEFPAGYGDNRIVLMVRDPHWVYAYWEIDQKWRQEIGSAKLFLRLYNTENWKFHDIEIAHGAINWYLHVPSPNKTYCVDIGFFNTDGVFVAVARSNFVTTPLDRMSDVIDEQWMIPDWDRLYSLSGGFGIGRSSGEIHEMISKQPGSGWLFSPSSPMEKLGPRPFWLVANCELIVYGATEPSATVTVQGRKISLREDGTFSLRFSLPDGEQAIPIEATRDDGAERRKITPIVKRLTE